LKNVQKQYSSRSKNGGSGTIFGISAAPSYLNIYNYPVLNFNSKNQLNRSLTRRKIKRKS
jgi:hypothetical protein